MDAVAKAGCGTLGLFGVGGGCFMTYDWQIRPKNVGEFLDWHGQEPLDTREYENLEDDPDWYYWYAVVKRHLVKQKAYEDASGVDGQGAEASASPKKKSSDDTPDVKKLSELSLDTADDDSERSKLKDNIKKFKEKCHEFLTTSLETVYESLATEEEDDDQPSENELTKARDWCTKKSTTSRWFVSTVNPEDAKVKPPAEDKKAAAAAAPGGASPAAGAVA